MSHDQRPGRISIVTTGPVKGPKGRKGRKGTAGAGAENAQVATATAAEAAESEAKSGIGFAAMSLFLVGAALGGGGMAYLLHG